MARKLAYRNLFHDRVSLLVTLVGIVFSVVLIAVQCSIYLGSEYRIVAVMDHIEADLWVIPVGTKAFDLPTLLLPGREKSAALSTPGVQSAEDLFVSFVNWRRLSQSTDKPGCATETGICGATSVLVVGTDTGASKTLPWDVIDGNPAELSMPGAVAVNPHTSVSSGNEDRRPSRNQRHPGDRQGRDARDRSFTTLPFIFSSLALARTLTFATPDQASYTLVRVTPGSNVEEVRKTLQARLPDAEVLTHDGFRKRSLDYWLFETGAGSGLIAGAVLGHHRRHRRRVADALCQHQGASQRVRHPARARCLRRLHPQGDPVAGRAERPHGLCPGHGAGQGRDCTFSATCCRS